MMIATTVVALLCLFHKLHLYTFNFVQAGPNDAHFASSFPCVIALGHNNLVISFITRSSLIGQEGFFDLQKFHMLLGLGLSTIILAFFPYHSVYCSTFQLAAIHIGQG
jgi:hypothetical protein